MRWWAIVWHVLFHTSWRDHRCRAMLGAPLTTSVYDELFRGSPPTPREERLLDLLSRMHLEMAYLLDFRNTVSGSLGELEARRAAMRPRPRTHSARRRPRARHATA